MCKPQVENGHVAYAGVLQVFLRPDVNSELKSTTQATGRPHTLGWSLAASYKTFESSSTSKTVTNDLQICTSEKYSLEFLEYWTTPRFRSRMAPYFETVKSFADVPLTDDGVATIEFLEASDGLMGMFDLLGVGVFSFVQADIKSNIHGVRTTYTSRPDTCHTLEKLVHSEVDDHNKHGTASLRRLLRGLLFTCRALQNARANPQEDKLQPSFSRAYDTVLRHHHNFAIRTVVQVALRACPRRHDFFTRIAEGGSQEKLDEELARWLSALDVIVQRMERFYEMGGHGKI